MQAEFCGCHHRQEQERKRCDQHSAKGQVILQFLLPSMPLRRRLCSVGRCVGRFLWRHTAIHWSFGVWVNMAASHHLIIVCSAQCGLISWLHVIAVAVSPSARRRDVPLMGDSQFRFFVRTDRCSTSCCYICTGARYLHVESS